MRLFFFLKNFLFRELEDYYPVIQFTQDLNLENIKEKSFWVVDVLNGFDNFVHGIAHEATVILLYEDRSLASAVIYDTLRDELFWSAPQLGAHLNQTRLRVSTRNEIQKSLLGIDFPKIKTEQLLSVQKFFQFLLQQNIAFRTTGAPFLDLAYMAAGRFDGLVMFDPCVIKCQVAELFSTESGGFSDRNYARCEIFCSGNEMIYKKLSENNKTV